MDNHHFQWENPLFLWPFSITMSAITRGYQLTYPLGPGPSEVLALFASHLLSLFDFCYGLQRIYLTATTITLSARDCGTLKRDNYGSLGFHGFNILFFFFSKSCGSFRCHPTHAPCFFENQDMGVVVKQTKHYI